MYIRVRSVSASIYHGPSRPPGIGRDQFRKQVPASWPDLLDVRGVRVEHHDHNSEVFVIGACKFGGKRVADPSKDEVLILEINVPPSLQDGLLDGPPYLLHPLARVIEAVEPGR